jgi:hypothetical protein
MGFLRKVLGGGAKVPGWADFMTRAQYETFDRALHADLQARGWTYRQDQDGIFVETSPGQPPNVFGLTNIAQRCASLDDPADVPEAVKEHFDTVAAQAAAGDEEPSFDEVRALLRPRVFATDQDDKDRAASSSLCPELLVRVAIDYPTSVAVLYEVGKANDWPPFDELLRIATENLLAEPAPEPQRVDAGNGAAFDGYEGDSFFVAARLVVLPHLVGNPDLAHALVAIPNRHLLLVHPIRDTTAIAALGTMVGAADGAFRAGPGSITPDVFWWHHGALTKIPAWIDRKGVNIAPPDAFTELLNSLAAPAD